jgi:D-lactate dehydrogenase
MAFPENDVDVHRVAFDIAEEYGKETFLSIRYLSIGWLPRLFAIKAGFDGIAERLGFLPRDLSDTITQAISRLFPSHLPKRMKAYRDRYEHHFMLKMAGNGIGDASSFLKSMFPSAQGHFFECTKDEGDDAYLHRFAAAGVRYRSIHRREVEHIVALDVALRRNDRDWVEHLPDDVSRPISHKLYYGHFFCHVFHQDNIVRKGHDTVALQHRMWTLLDARGAQYPAEHNVGHLYEARPRLVSQPLQGSGSLQLLQFRHRSCHKLCELAAKPVAAFGMAC